MMPRDKVVVAITGRHKKDRVVMAVLIGDSPEGQEMMARRNYADCAYERGVETATRAMMENVADGTLTQEIARDVLAKVARIVDNGEDDAPFE